MNYSHTDIKRKQRELISASYKLKYRIKEWGKCLGIFFVTIFLLMLIFGIIGAVSGVMDSSPVIGQAEILEAGEPSTMYDCDGNEMQILSYGDITHEYVPISRIPDCVQQAVVVTEDKRFYEHHGVSMLNMLGSAYSGIIADKNSAKTADTITKQLIQNQIPAGTLGITFWEKFSKAVKEQYLAIVLEDNLDKEQILEYYLNTINLGQNTTGVQAAARRYFDKDISAVTVSEAAVLAAVVDNPTEYNPIHAQEENGKRRRTILKSMLEEECISEEEYAAALDDEVYERIQKVNHDKSSGKEKTDSYYADAVVEQVIEDMKEKLGFSETEAYSYLYRGGLRIYSCQEPKLQEICDEVINSDEYYSRKLRSSEKVQASFVLMEQGTGKVKAIVGGKGPKEANRSVNRATELKCQPGSAITLLSTYTPALETSGFTLGDVVDDTKYDYQDSADRFLLGAEENYEGLLTIRDAIIKAKTIPALKTLQEVSAQTGYDFLKKFSFTTLEKKEDETETEYADLSLRLALGKLNKGVTNLELTSAYAAIASSGVYQTPRFYTKIVDSDGNVLLENKEEASRVIKEETAWLLTDVMQDVAEQENDGVAVFEQLHTAVAGYSGTATQKTEFWFEGFTPYYTAGIWLGTGEDSVNESETCHIRIWSEIMERVHKAAGKKENVFKRPKDVVSREICTKCGKLAVSGLCDMAEGGSTVRKEYFVVGTEPEENCSCHVKYAFCEESKQLATDGCPQDRLFYKVLLQKKESAVTADTPNTVVQNIGKAVCDIHKQN